MGHNSYGYIVVFQTDRCLELHSNYSQSTDKTKICTFKKKLNTKLPQQIDGHEKKIASGIRCS